MAARVPPRPYEEFAARAKAIAAGIPAEYMEGVEDVVVHRALHRHPQIEDIVTLGECEPSRLGALTESETVRSIVHLYYGSFVDLARRDPSFDADAELEETIRHEIQHHLEDKAGVSALIDEDDLFEAHARFRADLDVPPGWYRRGERVEPNVWAVDQDLFVEIRVRRKEFEALRGKPLRMTVLGEPVETEIPDDADPDEVFTLEGQGLAYDEGDGEGDQGHEHGGGGKKGAKAKPSDERDGDDAEEVLAGDLHIVPVAR